MEIMLHVIESSPGTGEHTFRTRAGIPHREAAADADAHLLALDEEAQVAARCSIWHRGVPPVDGRPAGLVGHYAAADREAGRAVLAEACRRLAQAGAAVALGPVDGSTWRSYRLVTRRGRRPPFFMEPDHPDDWPEHFEAAGFAPRARYGSAEVPDLTLRQPKYIEREQQVRRRGLSIRTIDPEAFEQELARIHALSLAAFARNFLYTPIDLGDFLALYAPVRQHLVPELVLFAERDGRLLGYAFGLPDLLQRRRGEPVDTAILKTLATRPGRQAAGLGGVLMERWHLAASELGYRRAIHALMHVANKSRTLSSHYGRAFREYTLFARPVHAGDGAAGPGSSPSHPTRARSGP